jgi:Xaa-Pro aminopeptidase
MKKRGASGTSFDTIAVSGTNSARPHGVPRPVTLEKGFLTMDFGCYFKGYASDMTRTVVIGKADEEMKKVYNTVLEAQLAAINAVREGMTGAELDKVARDIIYGAGYEGCFGHGLGHGVGIYIHENPRVSAVGKKPLTKGHIFTIEPGIYLKGRYGVRIEDMIQMTENGPIDITKSPKELIEIV